ncbi:Uncharacterised protein [Oligella urethralis]|uniref:VENN motif pre-toxin domain-containing protein n=1 Tax=Oligella urethralis TaxID=90245 RepID=UPI000E07E353|nr:VENN motif pre-toxin domain-containing protein [Oligella urethralis]SUA66269.1 Uncharacterised protein [Oligella urethralis]
MLVEYINKREQLENTADLLSAIAAGLAAPTDRVSGIVAASVSPSVAQAIGQYVKTHQGMGGEGSAAHLLAHGLLAGAVAAAGGNDMLSAAGAAITAEAAAPLLAQYLYGKKAKALTADEKSTLIAITGILGAGVGASSGSHAGIVQGGQAASNAVAHNLLTELEYKTRQELLDAFEARAKRGFTLEEAKEFLNLVQKDGYIDELIERYQADSFSLNPRERQFLKNALLQIAQGDENKVQYILSIPITQKIDDGRVGEAYLKARQQVGVDNSMDMKLARAAEPALFLLGGTGWARASLKGYGIPAAKSVAGGIGTSLVLDEDYKKSNLVYDLTLGVLVDANVKRIVRVSDLKGFDRRVIEWNGKVVNYFFGSGVSSAIGGTVLERKDTLIVEKQNLWQ